MKALVGFTGFVGSNLKEKTHFDGLYNSANIAQAFHTNPEILVYSGIPSEKFLANSDPQKDFNIIADAIENIKKINPKKIILISTVDVYPMPFHVNETEDLSDTDNQAYGKNRLYLEHWVEANCEDHLIVRLPALFGTNLRKNFIYDLIQIIPAMLNEKKFGELSESNPWLNDYYTRQENTFYKLNPISDTERKQLKQQFHDLNFTALNFTDSRGVFQFYNLDHLWNDIQIALQHNIKKLNLATEPVSVNEIYTAIFNKPFKNEILPAAPMYDFYTIHSEHFGGLKHYIRSKETILADIKKFIAEATQ